jgi:hypothetical protein
MTLRIEVQEFARACEKLSSFAQVVNGLTDEEREVMVMCTRALEQETIPLHQWPVQGVPLATPLSNMPLTADPQPAQLNQAEEINGGHSPVRRLAYDGGLTSPGFGRRG